MRKGEKRSSLSPVCALMAAREEKRGKKFYAVVAVAAETHWSVATEIKKKIERGEGEGEGIGSPLSHRKVFLADAEGTQSGGSCLRPSRPLELSSVKRKVEEMEKGLLFAEMHFS